MANSAVVPTRVFRGSFLGRLGGLLVAGIAVWSAWAPIQFFRTGEPFLSIFERGKVYVTDRPVAGLHLAVAAFFFLMGCGMFVTYATRSVTLDMDGVIVRGFGGGVRFMVPYAELSSIERVLGYRGSWYYLLAGGGRVVKLPNIFSGITDLPEELQLRSPQIVVLGPPTFW